MASKKRKKDPISTLLKIIIALAVVALIIFGAAFTIERTEKQALEQKKKEIEEQNAKAEEIYRLELSEYEAKIKGNEGKTWDKPEDSNGWTVLNVSEYEIIGEKKIFTRLELLENSPLMLTNRWHALPVDYEDAIEGKLESLMTATENKVPSKGVALRLLPVVNEALLKLINQAGEQEPPLIYFTVHNGFRSFEEQNTLYENRIEDLSKKNFEGLALEEEALKQVNKPGTSEYQTGYVFEIGVYSSSTDEEIQKSLRGEFHDTAQGKWFLENGWREGVVLRFPTEGFPNESWLGKSHKTGVKAKNNFYRFVGTAHATLMQGIAIENEDTTKQMVLEEYIDYLTENKHIAVYHDGTLKYEIYRIELEDPYQENIEIPLPPGSYLEPEVSLDNMGGVIVAITWN